MPLSKSLSVFRQELQVLLLDDLAGALKLLQDHLPNGTAHFNSVVGLLARLNDANKARLRGTVSNEELQRSYNGIRADFLDLINLLTEADFEASTTPAPDSGKPGPQQGSVLYRIPNQMPVQRETKCLVRIAVDEDAIVEDITIDEHVELKALKRVSDLMMVELTDPASEQNFKIRTTSAAEQMITREGYSEWFFYVEPVRQGAFPLEIKVSVIELVMGREAKKEYVLCEIIQIVADAPALDIGATDLKPAGVNFSFVYQPELQSPTERDVFSPPPSIPQQTTIIPSPIVSPYPSPASEPPAYRKKGGPLKAVALFLAFIVLGSATTWAVTPAATLDYWLARLENTETAYTAYLEDHPMSERKEEVVYRRAIIANKAQFYRQYMSEYGQQGQYRERISKRIDELETIRFVEVNKDPSGENVRRFLADFPDTKRISDLKKAIDARQVPDRDAVVMLENASFESIRIDPTKAKIRQFMTDFPQSNRMKEVNDALVSHPELRKELQPELEDAWIKKMEINPSKEQIQEYLSQFPEPVRIEKLKKVIEKKPALKKEMQGEMRRRRMND